MKKSILKAALLSITLFAPNMASADVSNIEIDASAKPVSQGYLEQGVGYLEDL